MVNVRRTNLATGWLEYMEVNTVYIRKKDIAYLKINIFTSTHGTHKFSMKHFSRLVELVPKPVFLRDMAAVLSPISNYMFYAFVVLCCCVFFLYLLSTLAPLDFGHCFYLVDSNVCAYAAEQPLSGNIPHHFHTRIAHTYSHQFPTPIFSYIYVAGVFTFMEFCC